MTNAECTNAELLAALKVALPHVQRVASFAPTTNANMGRVLQARKDRDLMLAVIAKAEAASA